MRRATRRGRLLSATAAGLVATAAPALAAGTTTPHCSSAQLRVKVADTQAADGHRYIDYAVETVGAALCSIRGYPGATVLNKRGQTIRLRQASVAQWPLSPLRTVVISPGQPGFFTLTWVAGGFCPGHAFTFYGLRVAPPGGATSFQWHLGDTLACNNSPFVSAVRPKLFPF